MARTTALATASNAYALGVGSLATAANATAFGTKANASGNASYAVGLSAKATETNATAFGTRLRLVIRIVLRLVPMQQQQVLTQWRSVFLPIPPRMNHLLLAPIRKLSPIRL